jgi:hypothetical protein
MIVRSKYARSPAQWENRVRTLFVQAAPTREWVLEGFFANWPRLNGYEWQIVGQYRWPKSIREALRAWTRVLAFDEGVSRHHGGRRAKIRYRLRNVTDGKVIALPSAAMLKEPRVTNVRPVASAQEPPPEAS